MKKIVLLILNTMFILPFLILFKLGALVSIIMIPFWLIMSIVNTVLAEDVKHVLLYNGYLGIISLVGVFACGEFYLLFVYADSIGSMITGIATIIVGLYIAFLTAVECLIKYLVIKNKRQPALSE